MANQCEDCAYFYYDEESIDQVTGHIDCTFSDGEKALKESVSFADIKDPSKGFASTDGNKKQLDTSKNALKKINYKLFIKTLRIHKLKVNTSKHILKQKASRCQIK